MSEPPDGATADAWPSKYSSQDVTSVLACTSVQCALMHHAFRGIIHRCGRRQHWRSAGFLGVRELSYTLPEDVRQQIEENKRNRAEVAMLHTILALPI